MQRTTTTCLVFSIVLLGLNSIANGQSGNQGWLRGDFTKNRVEGRSLPTVPASFSEKPLSQSFDAENDWAIVRDAGYGMQDNGVAPGQYGQDLDATKYEISLLTKSLELIDVDIRDYNQEKPDNSIADLQANQYGGMYPRFAEPRAVYWRSAEICYQPLYFEDVLLERYGQTRNQCLQPYFSAAHFFISAGLLPYNLMVDDPCGCEFPLGFCLPGNCTPLMRQRLLLD